MSWSASERLSMRSRLMKMPGTFAVADKKKLSARNNSIVEKMINELPASLLLCLKVDLQTRRAGVLVSFFSPQRC
jgi:hypothetical protein